MFNSIVRSKIEYLALLWDPIYDKDCVLLESLQKRLLKYCNFRKNKVYPPRGSDYINLCCRFKVLTLKERRTITKCKFIHALTHNNVDCEYLRQSLNFKEPRTNCRHWLPFYPQMPYAPIGFTSPMFRMCDTVNKLHSCKQKEFDIFNPCLSTLVRTATKCTVKLR